MLLVLRARDRTVLAAVRRSGPDLYALLFRCCFFLGSHHDTDINAKQVQTSASEEDGGDRVIG